MSSVESRGAVMTLPLCVRVDYRDIRSRAALVADGWREIETLNIFERDGLPIRVLPEHPNIACHVVEPSAEFSAFAGQHAAWSRNGRLWRDKEIAVEFAHQTYTKWVTAAAEDQGMTRILARWCGQPAGFMLIYSDNGRARINFFVVVSDFRNRGIGKAMLHQAFAMCGPVLRAGTQSDNAPASHIYMTNGFKLVEQQRTFHKS